MVLYNTFPGSIVLPTNFVYDAHTHTQCGRTALLLAAQHGHEKMTKTLIDHGADIFHRDRVSGMKSGVWDQATATFSLITCGQCGGK